MDDLFKQFRENLDERPEPRFDGRDWKSLEKQLGPAVEKRRGILIWWWFAIPVVLLSLASNVLFFNALEEVKKKVTRLELHRDTVFITNTIQRTDTVFQTRIVYQTVVRYLPAALETSNASIPVWESQTSQKADSKPETGASENNGYEMKMVGAAIRSRSRTQLFQPLLTPVKLLPLPESDVHPATVAVELPKRKTGKTIQQHLYPFRPKDFQVAASAGLAFPYSEGLERKSGYSYSLEASAGITPSLRLWGEATWFNIRFLSDRMGEDIGVPVVPPPADDFEFALAETSQPMLQYAAGMQYLFRTKKRWQPYLGLGYGAASVLPYEVSYEFKNPIVGTEWNFDQSVQHRALLTDFLLMRGGVEARIAKHWHWQIGATYRTGFKAGGFDSPNILGLQSGFKYGF